MAYFCFKCGRELRNKDSCCSYCGTWHGSSGGYTIKAVSTCKTCGRKLESGMSCCSYCGTWYCS